MQTITQQKLNKYKYLKVIQQNYGFGWEDNSEYEATSKGNSIDKKLFLGDLKEYRRTGYNTRVVFRKELNEVN